MGLDLDGPTARLTLTGDLTEAARRPLIGVVTNLLLGEPSLPGSNCTWPTCRS